MRALSLLTVLAACASDEVAARPAPAPAATPGTAGPIVVELFTSQGCSSCPPADRVLAALAAAGERDGRALAPLAFHVDYWDDLGWADPYAQPAWSNRQRAYARALGDNRVYTPEIVVGGAAGMVGSHGDRVTAAIAAAPLPALLPATAAWSERSVAITATAPADADVLVAIYESQRENAVPRGENAGSTLASTRVVRVLERVATAGTAGAITVTIDPAWHAPGAVVFAQRTDARIVASALLRR